MVRGAKLPGSFAWSVVYHVASIRISKPCFMAQISSLKSQTNLHFFFTLNNIYATAIESSPRTADMIDKLSELYKTLDSRGIHLIFSYLGGSSRL